MQYRYLTQAFRGSDAFDGLTDSDDSSTLERRGQRQPVCQFRADRLIQATLSRINQKRQQGLIDQRKDYLCFGDAKSDVELDDFWPSAVNISPTYRKPRNAWPSASMPLMTGLTISRTIRDSKLESSSTLGANAPIPPVLGPRSSSNARL